MRPSKFVTAALLTLLWLFLAVASELALQSLHIPLTARVPALMHGDETTWYVLGWTGVFLTAAVVLALTLAVDFFGAPWWHRICGTAVLALLFLSWRAPALNMQYGVRYESLVVWQLLASIAVFVATYVIAPRLSAIGARLPRWSGYAALAAVTLSLVVWFAPGAVFGDPPAPPGRYYLFVADLKSAQDLLQLSLMREDVTNRNVAWSVRTDRDTKLFVGEKSVDANGFDDAYSQMLSPYVEASIDETGLASTLVLAEWH